MTAEPNQERWLAALRAGRDVELKPWERVNLLEVVVALPQDEAAIASRLLDGIVPAWRLDELFVVAAASANEQVALRLLAAGATTRPLADACRHGLAELTGALIDAGARINRRFANELAPIHLAVQSPNAGSTSEVLVQASCDITVRTPGGQRVWDIGVDDATNDLLKESVGIRGPQWFREAQQRGVDHYQFVREGMMFGFNPNDVQTPILTGDESEGFGWPNTAQQAMALVADNRMLREQVDWFVPFLERLAAGVDFSLDDLGARVPQMRPAWR